MTISPVTGPVTLSPGDSIRISVWRGEQFSGQFGIAADGTIAHPMYQGVRAADIPLPDLDAAVTEVLREYIDQPNVVVEPLFLVVVVGLVNAPGDLRHAPRGDSRAGGRKGWRAGAEREAQRNSIAQRRTGWRCRRIGD